MKGLSSYHNKTPRRRFYSRPKWGPRPGKAWEPKTRRQERKYRTPRAFSVRAQWKYSENRSDERVRQIKRSVKVLVGVNNFIDRIMRRLFPPHKPGRISPDRYIVEEP